MTPWRRLPRLRQPPGPASGHWRDPDLFWSGDRRWFVATDVDLWSLYVGGDTELIAEAVTPSNQLDIED